MNLRFPDTNLCGQLFNDFLEGIDISKKYLALGEKTLVSPDSFGINLHGSYDSIDIRYEPQTKKILSVLYISYNKKDQMEMKQHIINNFQKSDISFLGEMFEYGIIDGHKIRISIHEDSFMNCIDFTITLTKI